MCIRDRSFSGQAVTEGAGEMVNTTLSVTTGQPDPDVHGVKANSTVPDELGVKIAFKSFALGLKVPVPLTIDQVCDAQASGLSMLPPKLKAVPSQAISSLPALATAATVVLMVMGVLALMHPVVASVDSR